MFNDVVYGGFQCLFPPLVRLIDFIFFLFIPRPVLRSQLLLSLDLLSFYTFDFNTIRLIDCSYYPGVNYTDLVRIKLAISFS